MVSSDGVMSHSDLIVLMGVVKFHVEISIRLLVQTLYQLGVVLSDPGHPCW